MALHELLHARSSCAAGGELGAEIGAALVRVSHPAREVSQQLAVESALRHQPGRRDHHALLLERARVGGHAARELAADVGVVGAAGGEAGQLAAAEDGGDESDVGKMGAAAIGVVEDPGVSGALFLLDHRRHRQRHRAQVHGDVLGLHDHLARGVEEAGGGVAALLHVGRVGGAHEHHAHLVARRPQRAHHHLQSDRIH